jgi:hypothetical protein
MLQGMFHAQRIQHIGQCVFGGFCNGVSHLNALVEGEGILVVVAACFADSWEYFIKNPAFKHISPRKF